MSVFPVVTISQDITNNDDDFAFSVDTVAKQQQPYMYVGTLK